MKKMIPLLAVSAILAAIFSYEPSYQYVTEKIMHIMAVKEQPLQKIFVKAGYEVKMKWEGNIWGGTCKIQLVFAKPLDELYESDGWKIGKMGRVVFLDKENYQVASDYCDKDYFTVEKIGAEEVFVYRHNFSCSAKDYSKICDVRYTLDNVVEKMDTFRKKTVKDRRIGGMLLPQGPSSSRE